MVVTYTHYRGAVALDTILLATNNLHKREALRRMLSATPVEVLVPDDLGLSLEVEESGSSFEENAVLKAEAYARVASVTALADDSGLEVDALGGAPGIYSARFGGRGLDDAGRVNLLLHRLRGVPVQRRTARYVSALAIAGDGGETRVFRGVVAGEIALTPAGSRGFGYDPVFLYPPASQTFAEMRDEDTARISHRGIAMRSAVDFIIHGQ